MEISTSSSLFAFLQRNWKSLLAIFTITLLPLFQVTTLWFYTGDKVDESELVHFAVGFLGGNLDPIWQGYGHLGMYIIGAVYFFLGVIAIILGQFESFTDYGSQLLTNGYFFIVARYVMAMAAVAASLICARVMIRTNTPLWLTGLFLIVTATAPITISYANYIRSDTFVLLFSIIALYGAITANGFKGALIVAISIAAAISCKISALPLGIILAVTLIQLLIQQKCNWKEIFIISGIFFILLFVFEPYMNIYALALEVIQATSVESPVSISRVAYYGFQDRAYQIASFHINSVGPFIFGLSLASFLGVFTRYSKLICYSWLAVFAIIIPYIVSTTLREYWFIPSYMILRMLGFITIAILYDLITKVTLPWKKPAFHGLTLFSVIYFPLYPAWANYSQIFNYQSNLPMSNMELAKIWLEENHLGSSPILIDGHYRHLYPKVYDLSQLNTSRETSRIFIYDRARNEFLSSIFENYLFSSYLDINATSSNSYLGLKQFRLDVGSDTSFLGTPLVCSYYSNDCFAGDFISSHDVTILNSDSTGYSLATEGLDPYLVFGLSDKIATDGSYYIKASCNGNNNQLFFNYGDGFSEQRSIRFQNCSQNEFPILDKDARPWVNVMRAGNDPQALINRPLEMLFVTSPAGYGRFQQIVASSPDQARIEEAMVFVDHYDLFTKDAPIQAFSQGSGNPIEIYLIPLEN